MHHQTSILAILGLLSLSIHSAHAQSKGEWMWRIGGTSVRPDVTSGNLSAPSLPNTKIDVKADTQVGGGITYMVTDHISVDIPLAMPFEHDIVGDGAIAGVGVLASSTVLPMTAYAQYRFFAPSAKFRPYVGAGLTYALFYDEVGTAVLTAITNPGSPNPTTLHTKDKLGYGVQLGATYQINDKWFVEGSYSKTWLKTTGTLSTGQTVETKLDPNVFSVGLGMRF